MEVEHEAKVAIIKADYEFQLKTLQNTHDERVEALQEKISGIIRQAQLDAEVDRKKIVEKYEREMNELRELLERQVSQDRATSDALQQQVNILQESLHDAKHQSEVLAEKYSTMVYDNEELRDFLDRVYEEQEMIQDMMGKQQEYMDAARAIRTELVQTLLQQEDQDGKNDNLRGTNVIEIASQVQRRINKYLEHRFNREIEREFRRETPRETDATANPAPTERRGPSRIEVERGEGDHIFSDHHGQTEVQAIYCVPGEDAKEPALTEEIRDEPATAEKSEEDYGEVRILADDISAITENSAY
jgi:chromosome segregation ATPase